MTNQPSIRPIIRATEETLEKNYSDFSKQVAIVSAAQAEAAKMGKGYEYTLDVLCIIKRRIIRKAGQS